MGMTTMYNLRLDPPAYNETMLDPLMGMTTMTTTSTSVRNNNYDDDAITSADTTTTTTTAPITPCNLTESCDSQLCLVTNRIENTSEYPTCCAWDLPVTMPDADDAKDLDTAEIIAVWLTIRQFETIFQHMNLLSYGNIISIESRGGNSYFNFSYIFMWIWGTVVMAAGKSSPSLILVFCLYLDCSLFLPRISNIEYRIFGTQEDGMQQKRIDILGWS
jgi:hypothetical protein